MWRSLNLMVVVTMLSLALFSCKDSAEISSSQALSMVEDYMEDNPIFETGKFDTKRMRLNSSKDQDLIEALQGLESEGFIAIVDEKKRKKWFSKDSVLIITPSLTDKAYPFIVKQNKSHTVVKTLNYEIDDDQTINFEKKNGRVATFNVMLLKKKTPFYNFGKDANPNSNFITRKFKAKYKPEIGWELVK